MITVNEILVNNFVSISKLPAADYVINPYVGCPHKCIYCYAEFMKRFTKHTEDWGDFIDIKRCNNTININKIENKSVLIGSVTDAYNPYEKKYTLTQSILNQLIQSSAKIEILTKSNLVIRDIELLKQIPHLRVGISINSLDDTFRKKTEPFASSIEKRLEALQILYESGIDTYVFMSPLFPGISNFKEIIIKTKKYTNAVYFENLNLRAAYFLRVMKFIEKEYPHLIDLYNEIYRNKNMHYWEILSTEINEYCISEKLNYKLYFYHEKIKKK